MVSRRVVILNVSGIVYLFDMPYSGVYVGAMKYINLLLLCLPVSLFASDTTTDVLGERLFKDIRFSQYFYNVSAGNVNHKLKEGAPELNMIVIRGKDSPSPFAGQAMSCASCHMVDQSFDTNPGGMRGYNDFAKTTKLPQRLSGVTHTLRNTPALVGIGSKYAQNRFSHHDGEFHDHSQTVLGNFTGPNMGWLKSEKKTALANIVSIVRMDKGLSEQAQEFGGSYQKLFMKVEAPHALDISKASDSQIIAKVVFCINEYMNGIDFDKDENGKYIGSAYDEFLQVNNLPIEPKTGQSLEEYSKDLRESISKLESPKFIKVKDFPNHETKIGFGEKELRGLKVFTGKGQCISCHNGPLFTDQFFHNTGTVQIEYDRLHGSGSFALVKIPSAMERKKDEYFSSRPKISDDKLMDLGLWNFYARSEKKILTSYVSKIICPTGKTCAPADLLPLTIGRIKTPTLRNLGHSFPYLHNGSANNIKDAIAQHLTASKLLRKGVLRNGAIEFLGIDVNEVELSELEAFLVSLNENYE